MNYIGLFANQIKIKIHKHTKYERQTDNVQCVNLTDSEATLSYSNNCPYKLSINNTNTALKATYYLSTTSIIKRQSEMSLTLLSTVCGFFSEPFSVHWTKLRMSAPNVCSGFLAANLPPQTRNNNRKKTFLN